MTATLDTTWKAVNTGMLAQEVLLAAFTTFLVKGHSGARMSDYCVLPAYEWRGIAASHLADPSTYPQYFASLLDAGWRARPTYRLPAIKDTTSADNIIWALPHVKTHGLPLTYRIAKTDGTISYT